MGASAATIALRNAFGDPGLSASISLFLDDSSQVVQCGADATDIGNIADLDDFVDHGPMTGPVNRIQQLAMYQGSWFHETQVLARIFPRG